MHLHPARLAAATFVAGCAVLGFTGPAGAIDSSLPADQIVKAAITATEAASSITFVGSFKQGKQTQTRNISDSASGDGQASIDAGRGVAASLRSVNGTVYFTGTKKFWELQFGKSAAQLFAGKWVSVSATSNSGKGLVAQYLNLHSQFQQIFGADLRNSTFTKAGTAKIGGQKAVVISGEDKSGKAGGQLYISATGQPYVLREVFQGVGGTGTLNFTQYNRPVHPKIPPNAIDLEKLGVSSTTG